MRTGCIPLLVMAAWLVQAQSDSPVTAPAAGLSIPAELTKTVRADKAHRGDPVEFTTLEAVLVGPNLVMPPHSKLFGQIVGAARRQGDKPSWLVLLVERAEWKQHIVPLHAFISSQITLGPAPSAGSADATPATGSARPTSRATVRNPAEPRAEPPSSATLPQKATMQSQDQVAARPPVTLKDLRIVRDKDGISYLFSAKSDVKLPGGTLFMLQNRPPTAPAAAASGPH